MSQPASIALILILLIPLWFRLRKGMVHGLAYAVPLLLVLTTLLRIRTPDAFPEITAHRLILISLAVGWWFHRRDLKPLNSVPLALPIKLWTIICFISLLGSINLALGTKRFLDFVLELFLYYFIVASSIQRREDAIKILGSTVFGITIVAILAIIERQTGFNLADFVAGSDPDAYSTREIRVTYRHRILLGSVMAMGYVLALAQVRIQFSQGNRFALVSRISVLLMLAACYFALSRGPWLATAIAGVVLLFLGSFSLKRQISLIALVAILALLAKPGVISTLAGYANATLDSSSFKGGTFQYRLELWSVAADAISSSPWRFLFGFGPGSGAAQSIEWSLSYRDYDFAIQSWDNDFAYAMYQYGILGMVATLVIYASIPFRLLSQARLHNETDRDVLICLGAATIVLFFMMTNVMIFARQLYYLLWTITAIGFTLIRIRLETDPGYPQSESPLSPMNTGRRLH